ncbi:hypothetical protein A2697_00390 [Candidatus Curtissbacteria bacterium RIFCSPHIGHO2_01_FULL_41_44]|nr:MAG: hypothetical protein A2697_00390 [Candidatus Curtissbacteria bacterium RIFCSPHIGHO2_01_FULL_41_44]
MPILDWTTSKLSKVKRKEAISAMSRLLKSLLVKRYTRNIIPTPANAPKNLQPKGPIPKIIIPPAIKSLASGGWVHS